MTDIVSIAIPLAIIGGGVAVGALFSAHDRIVLARGGPAEPSLADPATPPRPGKPRRAACRCRVDQPEVWRSNRA